MESGGRLGASEFSFCVSPASTGSSSYSWGVPSIQPLQGLPCTGSTSPGPWDPCWRVGPSLRSQVLLYQMRNQELERGSLLFKVTVRGLVRSRTHFSLLGLPRCSAQAAALATAFHLRSVQPSLPAAPPPAEGCLLGLATGGRGCQLHVPRGLARGLG